MADQHDTSAQARNDHHDDAASEPENLREDEREGRGLDGKQERGERRDDRRDREPRRRSRWPLIIVAIVVLVVLILGVIYWFSTRDLESTDDAYTDGRAVTIASHVSGYVTALDVNDNQRVKVGQELLQIDKRDFQAARDQAEGNLRVAEAQLANGRINLDTAKVSFPAKLAAARAQLDSARAALANAETEYKRQHNIPRAATTQQNIDTSTANLRTAQAQVAQAEAQVRENDLVPQLVAQAEAQVHQLEGQVEQAKAQLAQAELNLAWTKITAPQEGWITQRRVEKGNLVQAGQAILSIVTPDVWITANFKETQLNRMRPGQKVDISVDAYPGLKLTGHVDSIQLGSGAQFAALPPENATGNFVKIVRRVPVKIDIDHGLPPDMMLPLGISVTPTVHLK
jgi:membrane fusion protein (multidrug efflux system)